MNCVHDATRSSAGELASEMKRDLAESARAVPARKSRKSPPPGQVRAGRLRRRAPGPEVRNVMRRRIAVGIRRAG